MVFCEAKDYSSCTVLIKNQIFTIKKQKYKNKCSDYTVQRRFYYFDTVQYKYG